MGGRRAAGLVGLALLLLACAPASGAPPSGGAADGGQRPAADGAQRPAATGSSGAPAAGSANPAAATPAALRPTKLAYGFVSAEVIPLWIALDQGIFARHGLAVEPVLLQSSAQIAPAMASGEIDVALTAGAGIVDIDLAGGQIMLIAAQTNWMRFFLHSQPDVRRVEELRGKRVAITRLGSGVHLATTKVLERAGLEGGRDVTLIQAGSGDAVLGSLASGSADAAMLVLPANLVAERQGFPLLADLRDYQVPYVAAALAATRATLANRPALVGDFVRAYLEAMGVARREPALAQRLMSQHLQTDDADLLERSYRTWIAEMDPLPYPSLPGIQTILDQRAPEIAAARTADPRDFVDDRILRDLEASGFLAQALGEPAR
jgi:NitT/TauT family transport system substrate-binding protein